MTPPVRILPRLVPKRLIFDRGPAEESKDTAPKPRKLLPRRRLTAVACQNCRTRKIACGGARPKCLPCQASSLDCKYDTQSGVNRRQVDREEITKLQATVNFLQEILTQPTQLSPAPDQLNNKSPATGMTGTLGTSPTYTDASADLLKMLTEQPEDFALEVLRSLRQGQSPTEIMHSIDGNFSRRTSPSILTAARGTFTPTQTPLEFYLAVEHPGVYPPLIPLDMASLDLQLLGIKPLQVGTNQNTWASNVSLRGTSGSSSNSVHPQDLVNMERSKNRVLQMDDRLQYLNISLWTNVPISDKSAAEAISLYLQTNQPWWALFDTDLFVNDLINANTRFCSRMLVNAVLAWASQSYAHYEPTVATLSSRFLDEALRIYHAEEKGTDSLTTVAATSLMSMTWTTLGKDKVGYRLQVESARMAERLQLYGDPVIPTGSPLDLIDERVEEAACATAWGSFNFQMADATYAAVCKFWLIIFDMNYLYYTQKSILLSSAVAIFQRLLAWAHSLANGVERSEYDPDYVLNIHVWFHTAVVDLFRPFEHQLPQPKLPGFAGVNATPRSIIAASIQQLKRLIYKYRADCESSKYSIIWQSGMLYLVNYILRDLSSNESQFYFLLCMRGYQHLARYMPFVSGVTQSIMAMINQQRVVLTSDAEKLLEEVRSENHRSQEFFSAYPVDLETAPRDLSSATMEQLTHRFQEQLSVGRYEVLESDDLPDGWKGSAEVLMTTLSILKDS
ncbi:hypothetical protein FGRMN_11236 [Fusarium graminum]|nr:hypothetical protein FGRMN_11236 [Fusarium graminum]